MVCEVVEKEEPKIVAEDIIQDIIKQAILRVEKKLNKIPPQVQTEVEVFKIPQYLITRESISSYATLVATYVASFTIAQVALKAADIGLETSDGLLKWTSNEKVKHDVMVLLTLHYS